MRYLSCFSTRGLVLIVALASCQVVWGQQARFPTPVTSSGTATLGAGLEPFDQYATGGAAATAPSLGTGLQGNPYAGYSTPAAPMPGTTGYPQVQPGTLAPDAAIGYGTGNPYPSQTPSALYPGSTWPDMTMPSWTGMTGSEALQRFITDTGFYVEWLAGDQGRELDMLSIGLSTTGNWMKFPFHTSPLKVTPGFVGRFLSGPSNVVGAPNIPPQLYDAFLDFTWDPEFARTDMVEGHLNFRIGIYSDFAKVTTEAIRYMGGGYGLIHLSDTVAIKIGGEYIDRQKIKFFPAGGILWTPNNRTYFDIYFPRPKLKQYMTTLGNAEIWWYVGGEYGGGTWMMEKSKYPDPVDINDIRMFIGWEWTHPNNLRGFFEVGYVFDRKIFYRPVAGVPYTTFGLRDTVMLRAGLSF